MLAIESQNGLLTHSASREVSRFPTRSRRGIHLEVP